MTKYYNLITNDIRHIDKEADLILTGKTRVFGQVFTFNYKTDWLKDPVSGNFWPGDVFWIDAKFTREGLSDVKYVLEVNKLNDLVILATAFHITRDERYVEHIEKMLNGWISCVHQEESVANKIVMDLGFRVLNLIHVALLCYDNITFREKIHPKIQGILKQHVNQIWSFLSSRWFKSGNDNNHNIGEIVGLYIGQIWLRQFGDETKHCSDRIISKELEYLKSVTAKMVSPSGCYNEQSSNYTRVVCDFFLLFELFRNGLDNKRDFGWFEISDYFGLLSDYLIALSYHGLLPNFGDNDYARVVIPFEESTNHVSYVEKYRSQEIESKDYEGDGQWLYKSEDINDLFIFCRVGLFSQFVEGAFIHAHNDLLAVLVSAKGYPLFIDKGTLFYNSGLDIRKEFSSTGAHNTIQVGEREMADYLMFGYSNYPLSDLKKSEKKPNSCVFEAEVRYKDITHTREILYSGSVISINDVISKTSHIQETGFLRFLLADDIEPRLRTNTIELCRKNEEVLCTVIINGAESVILKETTYAPHYALRKKTHMIEAHFKIETKKNINTTIELS